MLQKQFLRKVALIVNKDKKKAETDKLYIIYNIYITCLTQL